MNKTKLIDAVLECDANLIWEIDERWVYVLGCWNGKTTWWNLPALKKATNFQLTTLLRKLDFHKPLSED